MFLSDAVAQGVETLRPPTHVWVLELGEADLRRTLGVSVRREVVRIAVLFLDVGVRWSQLRGL